MKTRTAICAAALLACAPVTAAVAATTTSDPLAEVDAAVDDDADDGDKGLWGLLGLLGLFAPLFNKNKRDDVHVHRTTTTGRNDGNPLT